MRRVLWLKKALEFLGGERDEPPGGGRRWLSSPLWGLWWAVLVCLIAMFCGQSSKFIYIDF